MLTEVEQLTQPNEVHLHSYCELLLLILGSSADASANAAQTALATDIPAQTKIWRAKLKRYFPIFYH